MKNDHGSDSQYDNRHQRITERAFARFEARGGLHGYDVEDWLEAEREETEAEASQRPAATPPPGLAPRTLTGNAQRDEESRREAERAARDLNRDAQRQLVR
jgi:hypothetical protein